MTIFQSIILTFLFMSIPHVNGLNISIYTLVYSILCLAWIFSIFFFKKTVSSMVDDFNEPKEVRKFKNEIVNYCLEKDGVTGAEFFADENGLSCVFVKFNKELYKVCDFPFINFAEKSTEWNNELFDIKEKIDEFLKFMRENDIPEEPKGE